MKAINNFFKEIQKNVNRGNSGEHSHRAPLMRLFEEISGVDSLNEPKGIECGAPDVVIYQKSHPVGYIETKDIGCDLDAEETSEQLLRYRDGLANLILTDYLEYRWYVDGELRSTVRIGSNKRGKISSDEDSFAKLEELFNSFCKFPAKSLSDPRELAERLAGSSILIKKSIFEALQNSTPGASILEQFSAFQRILIPDLDYDGFSDIYAQTICYGLFSSRCNSDVKEFSRKSAAFDLPKTNPFLRKIFGHIAGPDLDDRIIWIVDDLVEILRLSDVEEIKKKMSQEIGYSDPLIHFYESYLEKYDAVLRKNRGVYYTPEHAVKYIVNSIDEILKKHFSIEDGLADSEKISIVDSNGVRQESHRVLILDPAVGTGTFLDQVVTKIHGSFSQNRSMWKSYVRDHLLPRIFGFELQMAPYAVAHMKLGLKLSQLGYDFKSSERLGVFLTNTLDSAEKSNELFPFAQWLVEEANEASHIKRVAPVMVVLGNPPYKNQSANEGQWITNQIKENYYPNDERREQNPKNLQDDYAKFIRFGQWRIEKTGHGVLAFVTNNGFLANPTYRRMRSSLLESFDNIYVLNLNGSSRLGDTDFSGNVDGNIFKGIQQGTCITFFVRSSNFSSGLKSIKYAELRGDRVEKLKWLDLNSLVTTEWSDISPSSPYYLFSPRSEEGIEYHSFIPVDNVFKLKSTGVKTHRDHFVIDLNENVLRERIAKFRNAKVTDAQIKSEFDLSNTRDWKLKDRRESLQKDRSWEERFTSVSLRPFDSRAYFHHEDVVELPRSEVTDNLLEKGNLAFLWIRPLAPKYRFRVFVTKNIPHQCAFGCKRMGAGATYVAPLFVFENTKGSSLRKNTNFSLEFLSEIRHRLGLDISTVSDRRNKGKRFTSEDLIAYIYAILNSSSFEKRYSDKLSSESPNVPVCNTRGAFWDLVGAGEALIKNHLLDGVPSEKLKIEGDGDNIVKFARYEGGNIAINRKQKITGVSVDCWDFEIGGYRLIEEYLLNRKEEELSFSDLSWMGKIITMMKREEGLIGKIEQVLKKHGGIEAILVSKTEQQIGREYANLSPIYKRRVQLSAYIVDEMLPDENMTRVKFAKVYYLLDNLLPEYGANMRYAKHAAGPLDYVAFYAKENGVFNLAGKVNIFSNYSNDDLESSRFIFEEGSNAKKLAQEFKTRNDGNLSEVARVTGLLKKMTWRQVEVVSTLYACWNDLILKGKNEPAEREIFQAFYRWHVSKQKHKEQTLQKALAWMRKNNLVPKGVGKISASL